MHRVYGWLRCLPSSELLKGIERVSLQRDEVTCAMHAGCLAEWLAAHAHPGELLEASG